MLGKDVTLNFNNLGSVAQYTRIWFFPQQASARWRCRPVSAGNFNRFWTYDAQAKRLTEVTSQVPNGCANGT